MTDEDFRRQFGLTDADMADLNQLVSLMPDEDKPDAKRARQRRAPEPFRRVITVLGVALVVVAVLTVLVLTSS